MDWDKWELRFLGLAAFISQWSKDPSTKCGAVIVRDDHTIVSMGFNGFPIGVRDIYWNEGPENRENKLQKTIHAEMNAILFSRERLFGHTLYTYPFGPCCRCASHIIQSGILRVCAPTGAPDRWEESLNVTRELFHEAGVRFVENPFGPIPPWPPPSDPGLRR